MGTSDFLAQNREWADEQVRRDPEFFLRHTREQKPKLLLIGCSDSRVPAEQILKCGPGELFVHRNVANVVAYNDINMAAVVQYAVESLHIPDIVVCGHYACGGVAAACAENIRTGYIGDWLMITSSAKHRVDDRLGERAKTMDRDEYLNLVVDENVRLQVRHLSNLSVIRDSWRRDPAMPRLHGWVYDIANGRIRVVQDGNPGDPERRETRPTRA